MSVCQKSRCILVVLIILGVQAIPAVSQTTHDVQVLVDAPGTENLKDYKPGIFYFQFYRSGTNSVFNYVSAPKMYNALREIKFYSECWRFSTSIENVQQNMRDRDLKGWLNNLEKYTDRVVVKFNAMPLWISSSQDMTVLHDQSWREFMTHPPRDWQMWDSLITSIVDTISSWGIHPYYEIWNEPDGAYWKATDGELLKLYKHTALAIHKADPHARVGGLGMHTWWRSANPANSSQQQPYMGALFGPKPEALAERFSILYRLMDSVAFNWRDERVPLDFISYHHFNHNVREISYTADQLRSKMLSLGYCPPGEGPPGCLTFPELYISEWQTTYGAQEQTFQPPLFLNQIKEMGDAGITFHTIAALGDFGTNDTNEFVHDWGLLSQNNLVKPVYKALLLLSSVIGRGESVSTVHDDDILVFASRSSDTLRLLLANYTMPPVWFSQYAKVGWNGFETLLWTGDPPINAAEYVQAGHTSIYWGNAPQGQYGTIDLILQGKMVPFPASKPAMVAALQAAREKVISDSLSNAGPHTVNLEFPGVSTTMSGYIIRVDSTSHNVIRLYDSLRSENFSHQEAVDSLQSCTFPGGCYGVGWYSEEFLVENGKTQLEIDPNSVVFIGLTGVATTSISSTATAIPHGMALYPNPARDDVSLTWPTCPGKSYSIRITDDLGRSVLNIQGNENGRMTISKGLLPPGTYTVMVFEGVFPIAHEVLVFH